MTLTGDDSSKPLQPGQFSLLGLLSFMLAWSIYFSTIATMAVTATGFHLRPKWLLPLTVCCAWAVLALLYQSWRLRRTLALHCYLTAVFFLMILMLDGAWIARRRSGWEIVHAVLGIVVAAILWGLLVSLPVATLMLLFRLLRRRG